MFGRDELINEVSRLVDSLKPIALIGTGGIGKTSIALTVLHHVRIKERFGDNRRFIRCDQFPATRAHVLRRLSEVIGAGVENPENLTPLRPFLSSKEMLIVLDNAESILDPQGTDAQEIYAVVEELGQFENICLCITSRISTIPPDCESLDVPTLSMEAARSTFYGIYRNGERSDAVDAVLEQLDLHPLSITLLATVAHHNKWDTVRLIKEWEIRRTAMLQTDYSKSLSATIELSLASPMFQELGPDARALLEVIAFFPQGVNEANLDWLFPTIPNKENIFDKFYVLSLTQRSNKSVTMLAPLRDHLYPRDPKSSPLLCSIKGHFFRRLSAIDPDKIGTDETQWIVSEDVNVEHLLDVFTTIDTNSDDVWNACANFMRHLSWHKPRLVVLGSKIKGLPDDHPFKPPGLYSLSYLYSLVGDHTECKRLLTHALELWRERGSDHQVAEVLISLASENALLHLRKEGILQVKEASEIYERLDQTAMLALSLETLALLLVEDGQVDAAEEAASRAINISENPTQFHVCQQHYLLAHICNSRGDADAAISHFKAALGTTDYPMGYNMQSTILISLVTLCFERDSFDDAQVHLDRLKSHVANNPYGLGRAMLLQCYNWSLQGRLGEAKSEVSRIIDTYEGTGFSPNLLEEYKRLLGLIEMRIAQSPPTRGESGGEGEPLGTVVLLVLTDPLYTESG